MNTQALNLMIVEDNAVMATGLRKYLYKKFGLNLNISTFYSGSSALKNIDDTTNIVILDYDLKGQNADDVLVSIKKINPKTEVIILSSHEEIGLAIDSFCKGASDYVVKGQNAWQKIGALVYSVLMYPIHIFVKEFGVSKFVAIFIFTFFTVGIVSFIFLKFII